jgi:hypothetical protein
MNKYLSYDWTQVIIFESGGKSYYEKFLKNPTWPGGASGVTIGIGADLGYVNFQEYENYFSKMFVKTDNIRLKKMIRLRGREAKLALSTVKDIELSWIKAIGLFQEWTLPKFWKLAVDIWPGLEGLCIPAQVALVSIVFNRGASLIGPSRLEMRNIRPLILKEDYVNIAKEIRSMKRLWEGKGMDGLLKRRDIEADMVACCAK